MKQNSMHNGQLHNTPKIIAAIPCFNTEPFIGDVVLEARKHVDQVIVIDDGSGDGTAKAAKAEKVAYKKIAKLTSKEHSFLKEYFTKLYGQDYVDAMLGDY